MGCFNVAGTLSRLSIGCGDEAIFIPLANYNYWEKKRNIEIEPASMIVSNEGSCAYYTPRFLPIVGKYNDYGSLENIKRDANIEYIENYFGITIEQFMEQVTRNWCHDKPKFECRTDELEEELLGLSGMFEHYDVYRDSIAYGKKTNNGLCGIWIIPEGLERLGFIRTTGETGDARYNLFYKHPEIDKYVVYSSGYDSYLVNVKTGKKEDYIFSAGDFVHFLAKKRIKIKEWEALKKKSMYRDPVETAILKKQAWLQEKNKYEAERPAKLADDASEDEVYEYYKKIQSCFQTEASFIKENFMFMMHLMKLGYALGESYKESLIDLLHFNSFVHSANGMYFPASSGEQHGNSEVSQALYESALRVVNKKINEVEY